MAYGRKYFLEFGDNKENVWRISVLKDGYVGSVIDVSATGSPLTISYKGGGLFDPVRGSEATISFFAETDFQYSEFFTATEQEFIVQIKKDGNLFWQGTYIPENYSEPYVDIPYPISLKFGDGMGILKYQEFLNSSGALADGRETIGNVLAYCVSQLPYQLNLYELINIIEDDIVDLATNGFLNTTYVDLRAFRNLNKKDDTTEGWKCYDVIKELMLSIGCTMYQNDNKWYIMRIEEGETATINYLDYSIDATTWAISLDSSGTVGIQETITNTEAGITWLLQDAELELSDVFNEISHTYEYNLGEISNTDLIVDNDFKLHNQEATIQDRLGHFGIGSGFAGVSTNLNNLIAKDGGTGDFGFLRYKNTLLQVNDTLDTSRYLKPLENVGGTYTREDWITSTVDTSLLTINIDLIKVQITRFEYYDNVTSMWVTTDAFWDFQYSLWHFFRIQAGAYYLSEDASGNLVWTTTPSRIGKSINIVLGEYSNAWLNAEHYSLGILVKDAIFDYINKQIQIKLPVFPENDIVDLTLTCYAPNMTIIVWDSIHVSLGNPFTHVIYPEDIYYGSWHWEYLPDDNRLLKDITTVGSITGARDRKKEIKTKFGDGPHKMIRNSFLTKPASDYFATNLWKYRGSTATTFSVTSVADDGNGYAKYVSTTDTHTFAVGDVILGYSGVPGMDDMGYDIPQQVTSIPVTVPANSEVVTTAPFDATTTGTLAAWKGSSNIFIIDPYAKYFGTYRRHLRGTLYGDILFNKIIVSRDGKKYFQNNCNFNVIKNQYSMELIELSGTATAEITVGYPFIDAPTDLDPTVGSPAPDTNDNQAAKLIQSVPSINSQSMNYQQKSGSITQVLDEYTNVTNFKNYPQ
ncbi:MAG: hypothetical protein CMB80_00545 [Flammeovirgaceae bacterium]|nr:hypothetical protein [Flammeovirgaceae bacterium]|tara:strand:- start:1383 stop:3971 length:2589 start_codon:yes stop_codon:yes gene_type:complete